MVRGNFVMKRIENAANRLVTFSKRTGCLGRLLSYIIIFSRKGRLYGFSSSDMQKTIERYYMYSKEIPTYKPEMKQRMQLLIVLRFLRKNFKVRHLRIETANMFKIEFLEVSKRKLLGQGLGSCSVEELKEIGSKL